MTFLGYINTFVVICLLIVVWVIVEAYTHDKKKH